MPLVGLLSAMQEATFRNARSEELHPSLLNGLLDKWSGWVQSNPIVIDGESTRWRIRGKYDFIASFEDGTVGVIDCKVSQANAEDSQVRYAPQLEAYAYALENPANESPERVSTLGLLVWNPDRVVGSDAESWGFGVKQSYVVLDRSPEDFQLLLGAVIELLESAEPESSPRCESCKFVLNRNYLL